MALASWFIFRWSYFSQFSAHNALNINGYGLRMTAAFEFHLQATVCVGANFCNGDVLALDMDFSVLLAPKLLVTQILYLG